jgi:hypothetical protein
VGLRDLQINARLGQLGDVGGGLQFAPLVETARLVQFVRLNFTNLSFGWLEMSTGMSNSGFIA